MLNYKHKSKPPENFNQYFPISDLPFSKRDLSFSIKDYSSCEILKEYIMGFEDKLLKEVFIFDYFYNEKMQRLKLDLGLYFNPVIQQ